MNVAGVVVLYNPSSEVLGNIASFAEGVGRLYVVDNSEAHHPLLIELLESRSHIECIHQGKNIGLAGALNLGLARASAAGHAWALAMNQDSAFEDKEFLRYLELCRGFPQKDDVGIFTLLHNNRESSHIKSSQADHNELYLDVVSGNLINLKAFQTVGGFEDSLFMDECDHDYCLKILHHGFRIIQLKNVGMIHQLGEVRKVRKRWVIFHSETRWYYIIRNNLYVWRKYRDSLPELIKQRKRELRKKWWGNLLCSRHRLRFVGMCLLGCVHFAQGRFGKL